MTKIYLIFILIVVAAIGYINFGNEQKLRATVHRVEKIEKVRKSTDVYYLVFTDRGVFRVSIDGFFSNPEAIGILQPDSSYHFQLKGIEVPFLGFYPNVIKVRK